MDIAASSSKPAKPAFIPAWNNPDQGWEQSFTIPKPFFTRTMLAINSGNKANITNAVRTEVIATVSVLVCVHTMRPTPEQYTFVCEKLVKEIPILKDPFGCGFVSCIFLTSA